MEKLHLDITGMTCAACSARVEKAAKGIEGVENIPEEAVIFAATHQCVVDTFVWIPECPKHAVVVHSGDTNKVMVWAQMNTGLILVKKDKMSKSLANAKEL